MKVAFKKNMYGTPTRLLVTDASTHSLHTSFIGAVINKNPYSFTLPLDEIFVYQLKKMSCEIDPEVEQWITNKLETARKVVRILEQKDAPGDERLRPFQRVDVQFMKEVPIVLNANAMGTGKTVEAYALVNEVNAQKVLIVCGKAKMQDWEDEGRVWVTGDQTFLQIKGTRIKKREALQKDARFKIINYDATRAPGERNGKRTDLVDLWKLQFDVVIFDEAHRLKNKRAKRTEGAIRLSSQAQRVLFLTGTPMVNAPQELFPILHMMDPHRFSSYWNFVERFCEQETNPYAGSVKITGVKNLDHLQYILAPIMVQRKKKDVLPELPDKMYKNIRIELTSKQRTLYKKLKKEMLVEFDNGKHVLTLNAISLMMRLRQICCNPILIGADFDESAKTEAFLELVEEFVETGEKLIVFSFFKSYLALLSTALTTKGINHVITTGESSQILREANKKTFKEDPECNIFLITTSTGGEGLNLQFASNILFLDKPWTPAEMHQAEDRVHRMGQTKSPLIMSFTCKDTIEEYINKVVDTKDEMITETMAMERIIAALREEKD